MARSFIGLTINGIEGLKKRIQEYSENIQKEIDAAIQESVHKIVANAKAAAPAGTGRLKEAITSRKIADLFYEIIVPLFYSPYVEFGTGTEVDVPSGLEEYAMQFYVGPGVNLPAHPYLFPAFFEESKNLIKKIQDILRKGNGVTVIRQGPSNITGVTTI